MRELAEPSVLSEALDLGELYSFGRREDACVYAPKAVYSTVR